jgi:hypothetical protein
MIAPVGRPPISRAVARHDASFVTQLIATAQHSPQARVLHCAEPQVAHAAYRSTSNRNRDNAQTVPRVIRLV